ncbi:unnamed protein product [Rotaria socialis]|uniref:Uncharacterized protein n=1 Tax=Rotaria socialis TaxID=392032 RepID=A0A817LN77_9BILA|nr:unnamed protein product [Rotaria socialis]CAF3428041.1 unnamed protein product [Rotaria socialis]CAF3597263.1 unnamed protein product [Rotaria socialis]CAF3611728.1 unnamed protein product [Rotaria socialis]CAF4412521.1 unnamed protein product [Rotaria socialis]
MTFKHVEYLLEHTPNLQDLFLWSWYHLLSEKKMEIDTISPMFEIVKTCINMYWAPIGDDYFHQASDDFQQECGTIPFWVERNVTITDDEDYSAHDYRSDIIIRFNIKKPCFIQKFLVL